MNEPKTDNEPSNASKSWLTDDAGNRGSTISMPPSRPLAGLTDWVCRPLAATAEAEDSRLP